MSETTELLVREASELRADAETGVIEGFALRYNETISVDGYKERFERGAFKSAKDVKLFANHREPIGLVTELEDREEGLFIRARISDTTTGRDTLTLLRDGVLSKLSVGFSPKAHRDESGVIVRTAVDLREVSVVTFPAYKSSQVTAVREETETPINPDLSVGKETNMSDDIATDLVEVRETVEDLERRFSVFASAKDEQPATGDTRSAAAFVKALASGDESAIAAYNRSQEYLYEERAYTGGTSADAPVMDQWVGDLTRIFDASSGVLAQVFATGTLPAQGNNIEYAELLSNTVQVTEQLAEGDDLAYGKVTLTTKTAPVKTYGGYVQLTRQAIERSTLPVLNRSLEALAVAAGARKKAVLRAAFNSAVTAREGIAANGGVVVLGATLAASAAGNWEDALIDTALRFDGENASPEALIVSASVFKKLRSLTISGERVFTVASGNASGTLNLPGLTGSLVGMPVYLDAGQTGDKAVFVNGRAIRQYDSALVSLQDENVVNLSKDFSVYRYGAVAAEIPQFIVPVKLAAS